MSEDKPYPLPEIAEAAFQARSPSPYANSVFSQGMPVSKVQALKYFDNAARQKFSRTYPEQLPRYWLSMLDHNYTHSELSLILKGTDALLNDCAYTPNFVMNFFRQHRAFQPWFDRFNIADGEITSSDLYSTLHSMWQLRILPPPHFVDTITSEVNHENLSGKELIPGFIGNFARLGIVPERDFIRDWLKQAGKQIDEALPQQLATCAWSFAIFHALSHDEEFKDVSRIFLERAVQNPLTNKQRTTINTVARWLDMPEHFQTFNTTEDSSKWEKDLRAAFLRAAGFVAGPSTSVPELGRNVDIRINASGKDIIIEADGPFHFVYPADGSEAEFDGPTKLQTAILEKLFPEAVITRLRWVDIEDADEKEIGRTLYPQIKKLLPGTYTSFTDGNGKPSIGPFHGYGM